MPMVNFARGDSGRRTRNRVDLATAVGCAPADFLRLRRGQRRFDIAIDLLRLLVYRIVDIEIVRVLRRTIKRPEPIGPDENLLAFGDADQMSTREQQLVLLRRQADARRHDLYRVALRLGVVDIAD